MQVRGDVLSVRLLPVKFVNSFATWQHPAASGGLSYRLRPDTVVIDVCCVVDVCVSGLTLVQTMELNGLSRKLRDLENRFEQLVASRQTEDDRQRQLVELQRHVELIHIPHSRWTDPPVRWS